MHKFVGIILSIALIAGMAIATYAVTSEPNPPAGAPATPRAAPRSGPSAPRTGTTFRPVGCRRPLGPGTANLAAGPAMDLGTCRAALDLGAELAADLVDGATAARALVTGEMGIGNTTAAAALVAAFTGRPPVEVTGRGTGVDDAGLARKIGVVDRALTLHAAAVAAGPLEALAALGGFEIAALAGFIVGGAAAGVPVLVDGLIADAALLAAERLVPGVAARCIAGHRSVEPGAAAVLDELGLMPVLDLDLRLGEGSGACLALPVVEAAARVLAEMATFDAAGVTDKDC